MPIFWILVTPAGFDTGNECYIKSSKTGFSVGLYLIAVAHDSTKSEHHTVIETLVCTVKGSDGLQHIFFKQIL